MKRTAAATFYVTAAATLSANIYASNHTPVGVLTGLWGPLALFLSLELVERSLRVTWARVSVAFLALVAGWVSYGHLVHVFTEGGADPVARYLLPLTVDVLMAIARVAMVHRPASTTPSLPQEEPAVPVDPETLPEPGFINHRESCTHAATPAARRACRRQRERVSA